MGKANDWANAFTSTSVTTTEAPMTGSPYSVTKDSVLQEALLTVCGDAATSLIESLYVKLGCKEWSGREVILATAGAGIRTAPAFIIPSDHREDLELPCPRGSSITAVVCHVTGATPVTPRIQVYLGFEN